VVHHIHNVRSSDLAHLILRIIQICDLFVDTLPRLADERHICHTVLVAAHVCKAANNGSDLLVTEDPSCTATTRLLEARLFPTDIVPGGVDRCNAGVLCGLTSRQNRNSAFAFFVAAIFRCKDVCDQMRIFRFK